MIKQIRIRNFRSLVDVTVDLDPLTVLIGRSGTGKSNFVEAIRFLRDSLATRTIDYQRLGGVSRVLHVNHRSASFGFEVNFSIAGFEDDFHYCLQVQPPHQQIVESLHVCEKAVFHHVTGKWITTPNILPTPTVNGIMLGAIPGLQESTFAYVALRNGLGCYDFPGDVLSQGGTQGMTAEQGLTDRGVNYLSVAERIQSDLGKAHNWKRIAKSIRSVNRSVANLTLNAPTPDRISVGLQFNGKTLPMEVTQESEGFRRYLAHLLALYQNPSKQTLIFEHPEAGLHPGALESLAEEFKDCPDEGRGQVILTTHSPQLLDYFPASSIRVVDIEHQETRIGPLSSEQLDSLKQHLLFPGELLTVDPARLPGQLDEVAG